MKKIAISVLFTFLAFSIVVSPQSRAAGISDNSNNSYSAGNDVYEQTIIELLMPQIDQAIDNYYKNYFNLLPGVAPYLGGKVLSINYHSSEPAKNIPYSYEIVVQVEPYFGPHITVGTDNLTFRVFAGGKAQLEKFDHVKSNEIPQNYRDTIIGKWPPGN